MPNECDRPGETSVMERATPHDRIDQARQLVALGFCDQAAMTIRVALERRLFDLFELHCGDDHRPWSLGDHLHRLVLRGVLPLESKLLWRWAIKKSNSAVHGRIISVELARELLQTAEQLFAACDSTAAVNVTQLQRQV